MLPADLGQRWRSSGSVRKPAELDGQLGRLRATVRKSFRGLNQPSPAEEDSQRSLMGQLGLGAAKLLRNVYATRRAADLVEPGAAGANGGGESFRALDASSKLAPRKSQHELEIEQRLRRSKRRVLPSARYQAPESERACDGLNLDQLEQIKRDNLRLTLRQQGATTSGSTPTSGDNKELECSCNPLADDCSCSSLLACPAAVGARPDSPTREICLTRPRLTANQRDQIEDRLRVLFEPAGGKSRSIPPGGGLSPSAEDRAAVAQPAAGKQAERRAQSQPGKVDGQCWPGELGQQQVAAGQHYNQTHAGTESHSDRVHQSSADQEFADQASSSSSSSSNNNNNNNNMAVDWDEQEHLYASICNHSHTPSPQTDNSMASCRCTRNQTGAHYEHQLFGRQLELVKPREEASRATSKQADSSKRTFLSRIKQLVRPAKRSQATRDDGEQRAKTGRHRSYTLSSKSGQKLLLAGSLSRAPSMLSIERNQADQHQMREGAKSSLMSGFLTLGRLQGARSMSCLKQADQVQVDELFQQSASRRQEVDRLHAAARFGGSADSLPSADSGLSCSNLQNSSSCDENYPATLMAAKSTSNLYSRGPSIESVGVGEAGQRRLVGRARAKVDCNPCAYDREALVFRRGDIIDILERNESGTWIGHCNGQVGHFKFINVDEISQEEPETSSKRLERPFITKLEIRSGASELAAQPRRSASPESVDQDGQALDASKETIMSSLVQLLFAIGLAGQQVQVQSGANEAHNEPYLNVLSKGGINSLDSFSAIDSQRELEQIGILDDEHQRRLLMAAMIIRQASHAARLDFVENCRSKTRAVVDKAEEQSCSVRSTSKSPDKLERQTYAEQTVEKIAPPPRATSCELAQAELKSNVNEPIYINLLAGSSSLQVQSNEREPNQLIASTTDLTVASRESNKPQARAHDPPGAVDGGQDQPAVLSLVGYAKQRANRSGRANSSLSSQRQQIAGQSDNRLLARRSKLPVAATSIKTKPETLGRSSVIWTNNSDGSRTTSLHNSGSDRINQQQQEQTRESDHYHYRTLKVPSKHQLARSFSAASPHPDTCATTTSIAASSDEEDEYLLATKNANLTVDHYDDADSVSSSEGESSYSRLNRGYSVRVAAAIQRGAGRGETKTYNTKYFGVQGNLDYETQAGWSKDSYHDDQTLIADNSNCSTRNRVKQFELIRRTIDGQQRRPSRTVVASSSACADRQVLLEQVRPHDDQHQQTTYHAEGYYHIHEDFPDMHRRNYRMRSPLPAIQRVTPAHHLPDHRQVHQYDHERRKAQVASCAQQPTIVVPKPRSQINSSKSAYDLRLDLSHFFS